MTSISFFAAGFFHVKNYDSGLGFLENVICVSGPVLDFCSCSCPDSGYDLGFDDGFVHDPDFFLGSGFGCEICSGFYGYGYDFEIYA